MAWGTPTQPVAQATQAAVNPTSVVSDSFTPTANSVLIASVMMGRNNDTAVFSGFSGHGTWSTTITSAKYGDEHCEIVIGVLRVGASPTADTVTASFSSAPARAILAIQQITTDVGVDENIVVQSASSGIGTAVSSLTGDFAAAPSASSMLVAFAVNAHGIPRAIAAATDWTSLGVTSGNGVFSCISQYRTGTTSTTYGTGPFTNGDAEMGVAIAAVELQEAAAGATLSLPTSASITQTTATVGCTTTSATGTLYAVVSTSATPPTAADIEAGTGTGVVASGNNATLTADVANTIAITGLTADTAYYAHFVQDTGTAEYSNIVSTTVFTTLALAGPVITDGVITAATTEGFQVRFTTDTANGTAYYVVEPTGGPDPTALQISNGQNDEGNAALRSGSQVVSATGVQTFAAVTGLDPNTTYRASVVHYGNPA